MGNRESAIAERLLRWEKEYREGNKERCLDVICICLQFNHAVPQWAIEHFISSMWRYRSAEAWKLDEAFGIRRPKGQKKVRVRKRYELGLKAHLMTRALAQQKGYVVRRNGPPTHSPRTKKGKSAVAEVAKQLSMKDADVERWYYDNELMKYLGYPQPVRRRSKKTEGD